MQSSARRGQHLHRRCRPYVHRTCCHGVHSNKSEGKNQGIHNELSIASAAQVDPGDVKGATAGVAGLGDLGTVQGTAGEVGSHISLEHACIKCPVGAIVWLQVC